MPTASIMSNSPLPDTEDAALLTRWRDAGDRVALGSLYARHADTLWRLAVGLCGNDADADDAVQQALILAMRSAHQWRGGAVQAWLVSITANCCREQLRRARRRVQHEQAAPPPPPAPAAATASADDELHGRLRQALAQLPAAYAQPVILAYVEGMTSDAIAAVLGLTPAAVRKRCERGLARLRADRRLAALDPARSAALLAGLQGGQGVLPGGADPQRLARAVARGPQASRHAWQAWHGTGVISLVAILTLTLALHWAWPSAVPAVQPSAAPAAIAPPPPPVVVPAPPVVDPDRALLEQRISVTLRRNTLGESLQAITAALAGQTAFDSYAYYSTPSETPLSMSLTQARVRDVLDACTAPTRSWRLAHGHLSIYRRHGPYVPPWYAAWDRPLDELRRQVLAWCRAPLTDQGALDALFAVLGSVPHLLDEGGVPLQVLDDDQEVLQAVQARLARMTAQGVAWNSSVIMTCGYLRLTAQVPELLAQLGRIAPAVRNSDREVLIEALGWSGDARAVPALERIAASDGGWHIAHALWVNHMYLPTLSAGPQPAGECYSFVRERVAAITALSRIADPAAQHVLERLLTDREAYAPRFSAARLLATHGHREDVALIRTALGLKLTGPTLEHWQEDDPEIIDLCWSLCQGDPQRGVLEVLALLAQPRVRADVLHGLVGVTDARLAPALLRLLRQDGALAEELAYHAIHPPGWQEPLQPDSYLPIVLAAQANAPQVLGAALLQPDADPVLSAWRIVAATVLGETGAQDALRILGPQVTDQTLSDARRATAAYAIGLSRQDEAVRPLGQAALHDTSPEVRRAALAGLSMLTRDLQATGPSLDGHFPASEALLMLVMQHDPDPSIRRAAVTGYNGTPEWVDGMTMALMGETDPAVIKELVRWIGQIRYRMEPELNVLHVHDRCLAALILAPAVAQPAASTELAAWLDEQPGDGQNATQLNLRLKTAQRQCHTTGLTGLDDLTQLLDHLPPASAAPAPAVQRQF